jgi:hypothetical protein
MLKKLTPSPNIQHKTFNPHPLENILGEEKDLIQLLEPLPAQSTNQPPQTDYSSRNHQQPKSQKITMI